MMPGHDGLWLAGRDAARASATRPSSSRRPTPSCSAATRSSAPIADFLIKPFQRERFALAVDRGRQWRKQALEEVHWHAMLSIELRDRAAQVVARSSISGSRPARSEDDGADEPVRRARLPDVAAHGERVARYALSVARELGLDATLGPTLEIAARFHDIGKLAMPEALLTKPSPLTPGEMAIMRQHVDVGGRDPGGDPDAGQRGAGRPCVARVVRRRRLSAKDRRRRRFRWRAASSPSPTPTTR